MKQILTIAQLGYILTGCIKNDEIDEWIENTKEDINKSSDKMFSRAIFFRVETYSNCVKIWRDDEWWKDNAPVVMNYMVNQALNFG